jgi:hypothetical protein
MTIQFLKLSRIELETNNAHSCFVDFSFLASYLEIFYTNRLYAGLFISTFAFSQGIPVFMVVYSAITSCCQGFSS